MGDASERYASPESVFATAQKAMERGDWEAFFDCIDRTDLMRLARMGIPLDEGADDTYFKHCVEHGMGAEALIAVKELAEDIRMSAHEMLPMRAEQECIPLSPKERLQRSLRHRDLVKLLDKAIGTCLKSATNLAAFAAMAERRKRARTGGGSVSSTLFVGESLVCVTVEGKKASGTRLLKGGWKEPIRFTQTRGRWYIKFMPSARSRPK